MQLFKYSRGNTPNKYFLKTPDKNKTLNTIKGSGPKTHKAVWVISGVPQTWWNTKNHLVILITGDCCCTSWILIQHAWKEGQWLHISIKLPGDSHMNHILSNNGLGHQIYLKLKNDSVYSVPSILHYPTGIKELNFYTNLLQDLVKTNFSSHLVESY